MKKRLVQDDNIIISNLFRFESGEGNICKQHAKFAPGFILFLFVQQYNDVQQRNTWKKNKKNSIIGSQKILSRLPYPGKDSARVLVCKPPSVVSRALYSLMKASERDSLMHGISSKLWLINIKMLVLSDNDPN